jgi:hypothetical protein
MKTAVRVPLFALSLMNFGLLLAGPGAFGPHKAKADCVYCNTSVSPSVCQPVSGYWSGTTQCRSYPGTSGGCNVGFPGCN